MEELTEEKRNSNFAIWVSKLQQYHCHSDSLISELGDKLLNATYNGAEKNGGAYDGALIDIVLNNLCVMATHLNVCAFGKNEKGKLRHKYLEVDQNSLMRVLLLQHISKSLLFVPQTNKWKKDNGFTYEFNGDISTQLKVGEKSAYLCFKHGIELSECEYEAMTIIDKEEKAFNSYINPLAYVVKTANNFTAIELQQKYNYLTKD